MCLEAARKVNLLCHVLPATLSAKRADSKMQRTRAAGCQANLTASEYMPIITVCIHTLYNKNILSKISLNHLSRAVITLCFLRERQ